ncbi:putative armadillo-like helical protein [Plasmopara halstedii]
METNRTDAVPTRNKSAFGKLTSKLRKNFGIWKPSTTASPTTQNLIRSKGEASKFTIDQQRSELEENNKGGPEEVNSRSKRCGIEKESKDDHSDEVSTSDASVFVVSRPKHSFNQIEQIRCETHEQNNDASDEDEQEIQEEIRFQSDHETDYRSNENDNEANCSLKELPHNINGEVDLLDIVAQEKKKPILKASSRIPADGNEDRNYDDDTYLDESLRPTKHADFMVSGVTLTGSQNHTTVCSDHDKKFIDKDIVTTPRTSYSPSSPLKRMQLGPGIDMMPSCEPLLSGSCLSNLPFQDIHEENDRPCNRSVSLQGFRGRPHSETSILSSASQIPEVKSMTEKLLEDELQLTDEDNVETTKPDTGALITQAFGERIVSLLAADAWADRQDAYDAIKLAVKKANVSSIDSMERQRLLCASLAAVQCGVEDRVAPVMYCALECFRAVLKEFARVLPNKRAKADVHSNSVACLNTQLSSLVGALVKKIGDSNKRTQREVTQALIRISRLRSLRAIPHLLFHLSGREVAPRRQLEMLRRLIQEFGLSSLADSSSQHRQLTVETVVAFVAPNLTVAEEKTRKVAVEILADIQTLSGKSTAWQAQLACVGTYKPEMLRVITRRVDELLAKRQQQHLANTLPEETGSAATNQAEEQADDEAAFPPAELVTVPQEDSQSSMKLLEILLSNAQHIVGPVNWRKLSSKMWNDRKEALLDIDKAMTEAKSDLRDVRPDFGTCVQSTFAAYSALLHRALGDSIAPVANTALDTYTTLIKVYGPRVEWRETNVRDVTLLLLLRMLAAMQKPNTRTTRAACRGVLKLARLPNARHPLRYVLSCVFNGEGSSACDVHVQMHMLRLLVPEFGFQADGLGASRVLEVVCKGLTHNSARMRRSAADVALSAQRLLGRDFVLTRLQGVKSVTLRELEKSFVDGAASCRPQTVATDALLSGATGSSLVTLRDPDNFLARRWLQSAPVSNGHLQCTPDFEELSTNISPQSCASNMSHEDESLMDSILGSNEV